MQEDDIYDDYHAEELEKLAYLGNPDVQLHQLGEWKQHKQVVSNYVRSQPDKGRMAPLTHLMLFSEDMRISRILRRLNTEKSPVTALEICEKLEIAVRSPNNVGYICRSFEMVVENLIQALKQCPIECVQNVSNILGIVGYINRSNFPAYKTYITKTYQNTKSLRKYLMLALKSTFRCDAVNLDLLGYSKRLLEILIDYLENAEKAEMFTAISETIVEFSKNYEGAFSEHFTDIVDIVVGWHLEADQPQSLKLHCALVLQKWAAYFLNEFDFTYGLLGQFLEDIIAWMEDLTSSCASKKAKMKAELRIAAFIGAFTTILKSLSTPAEFVGLTANYALLENAVCTIMKSAKEAFSKSFIGEEIVLNVNDFLSLLLAHNYNFEDMTSIETLITLQIGHIRTYSAQQNASLLYMILCLLRHQRTSLSRSVITTILGTVNNPFSVLKLTSDNLMYKILLKIYHEVLMLKNVPLLQEAYKYIKCDMKSAMIVLNKVALSNIETNDFPCAVQKINFYLSALSVLATQTSSIISMYALDPSILELLVHHCEAGNVNLWIVEPALHNALLNFLAVHCQKNHNFITTSRLLQDQQYTLQLLETQSRNSPTSDHFTQILQFFSRILIDGERLSCENLKLLLNWFQQLLEETREHSSILTHNEYFLQICKSLSKTSLVAPIESANCMRTLLKFEVSKELLMSFRDVAIYHLNSYDSGIMQAFANVFAQLPLSILVLPSNLNSEHAQQLNKVYELKKWYRGNHHYAPLRVKYFKEFLDYLSLPEPIEKTSTEKCESDSVPKQNSIIEDIFKKCFITQAENENDAQYEIIAKQHRLLMHAWIENEAARYCVRNKLRTTVGKPQETFLAIEAIIMKYARMLTTKDSKVIPRHGPLTLENAIELQHKSRILLGFLEYLEKHIYNAAQGTAFAFPTAEKPAKTFFRINASTCNEWFKRIRLAVCVIATHCMEPEIAIRYSEQTLTKVDQINSTLLEHTLIHISSALITRNEHDSLVGLHVWIRNQTGKNFSWLQHAAEQAGGHLELAATGYRTVLDENEIRSDSPLSQFILEQLIHCLYFTGQWKEVNELQKWYASQSNQDPIQILNNAHSSAHLDTMHTLCYGNQNGMECFVNEPNLAMSEALVQLMDWSTCEQCREDFSMQQHCTTLHSFSNFHILRKVEDNCIVQALKSDSSNLLDEFVSAIQAGLRESFSRGCNLDERKIAQGKDYIFINHVFKAISDPNRVHNVASFVDGDLSDSTALTKCLLWTLLLGQREHARGYGINEEQKEALKLKLYLDSAASARQDGNYQYCRKMLQRFFQLKGYIAPLDEIAEKLRLSEVLIDVRDNEFLRGISELSKCIYSSTGNASQIQQHQCDAINLSASLCLQMTTETSLVDETNCSSFAIISSETLLNVADWLGQRNSGSINNLPQLQNLLNCLPDTTPQFGDGSLSASIPAIDKAVGRLINASICQQQTAGETWLAYGNWCYRWGKKLVEMKNTDSHTVSQPLNGYKLTERDFSEIKFTLKIKIDDEILKQVSHILERHQLSIKADVVDEELESNDVGTAELIEQELRQIEPLAALSTEEMAGIIRIWRRTQKTVYSYYETAIRAYLKYLSIETMAANNVDKRNGEDCGFVTTTLRILRLVVKHAFALQDVLEEGLNSTPLRPWRVIIPQLFSRLNHHEPYVRNSLAQLLCRLAQDEPHAVIFPAVVGSQEEGTNNNNILQGAQMMAVASNTPTAAAPTTPTTIALSNCFSSLVTNLSKEAPETVRHVQLLVKELRRVAVLWEEYWLHSLGRLLTEYSSLFSGLVIEMRKCNRANVQQMEKLIAKHETLLQYVTGDLQKIAANTEKAAETKYEHSFKEHYQSYIDLTIKELLDPNVVTTGPVESWQKLKNLYQRFQQRSMHGSSAAASTLKIGDLSPILANMHDTSISMPGVECNRGDPIFIKAIENTVHILPTKTRPKKLVFLGSDGRKYTYLFKGLEDLHLDERIMQFLSISNLMMERTRDQRRQLQAFRAHYYSVIPLGPQSGLISWVEGVTPLFAIYKKWQQRDVALKQMQSKEKPNNEQQLAQAPCSASSQFTALRPSELFYKKIRPLLAAQNIKLKDPRKQWPLSILRRVLDELSDETPNDLLSKELWCHATSAAEWRKTVRNYSVSMAVMSVIGYIIGLGDRHLDNVLINLSTGEIVHIDYNVCFEKGKTLRVPEKVPFRLTPNLEKALGVTGVEGTYRLGCEYVLRTLRKEKETLLTLLEAFVYDPLVDWTVSDDGVGGGTTRATLAYTAMQSVTTLKLGTSTNSGMEITNVLARENPLRVSKQYEMVQRRQEWELMQQTIKARFEDMRNHWSEYMNEIQQYLLEIGKTSQELNMKIQSLHQIEDERNKLNQQVAKIRELEMLGSAIGSHSLNTLTQRYQIYKQDAEALESLRKNAKVSHTDIETLLQTYFRDVVGNKEELTTLNESLLQQKFADYNDGFKNACDYIKQNRCNLNSNAALTCEDELDDGFQQETSTALQFMTQLYQYARIMSFYPRTLLRKQNALFYYANWHKKLYLEETDLMKLRTEIKEWQLGQKSTIGNCVQTEDKEHMKIIEYFKGMEKISYQINFSQHNQQMTESTTSAPKLVDDIIDEIKDFASLDENTCITLQGAMLQVLTKTLSHLDQLKNSPKLYKDINFIQNIELIFENLQLNPKTMQQLSEQKLLKTLNITLKALDEFQRDFIYDSIVELFFLDDNLELQDVLNSLCKGELITIKRLESAGNAEMIKFHDTFLHLQTKFEAIERQLQILKCVTKEVLQIESCSWFNILLERLSIIPNLSDSELMFWRNAALTNLFKTIRDHVSSFKTNRVEELYDVRQFYVPIKNYVNQIYSKYLYGVTIALAEAYINSFQGTLEYFDTNAAARSLCSNLVIALQQECQSEQLCFQKQQQIECVEHYNHIMSAYYWVNQNVLKNVFPNITNIIIKDHLTSISHINQSMNNWKHAIVEAQNFTTQQTKIIKDHLNCILDANVESKDTSIEIVKHFEECVEGKTARYNFFMQLVGKLIDTANVVQQFETLMDDNVTGMNIRQNAVESFYLLIGEWQQVRKRYLQSNALITPVEKNIVQLLDPEDKVDACWIENISGLLDELLFGVQRSFINLEEERKAIQEQLYEHANELQNLVDNPLRTDMRQLLRLIIKNAKFPTRGGRSSPNLADEAFLTNLAREVLQLLKALFGKLGELKTKLCLRDDYDQDTLKLLNEKLSEAQSTVKDHQKELNSLVQHYLDQSNSSIRSHSASPMRDRRDTDNAIIAKDATATIEKKGEQKRNVYAVSVWKRIRMKLEGRDPDTNRRSTIVEQVDFIINEAINRDNLAVLYEGWTPWV